jgi:hypothetical protein
MAKGATLTSGSALLPDVGMSQSSLMLGALLAGFVVWLGMQGKLAAYWSILIGGGSSTAAPAATTTTPSATTPTAPATTTTAPTTSTTTNPLGLPSSILPSLGGTADPFAAVTGGVGYNATKPGAFSGLTASPFFSGSG